MPVADYNVHNKDTLHGALAFALILVDRQEGGRENIESKGYPVVAAFTRPELV